jgi:hypothetical protein
VVILLAIAEDTIEEVTVTEDMEWAAHVVEEETGVVVDFMGAINYYSAILYYVNIISFISYSYHIHNMHNIY